ncbi:MAG TPA: CDP-alcohol phosphatidyltransferase family protein [Gemmatimonadales bacterium]|nr:CDP-alcohol phosphatidyltransferase family protein [Gemmatimonadales bacterium]
MKLVTKPVERAYFALTRPVVDGLTRAGIRPNLITTVGTLLVVASAAAFGIGRVRLGGLLYLVSGIVDTLDGAVARANGQVTRFGAFYDSTLDRVGDGATFMGIAVFYLLAPPGSVAWRELAIMISMTAIIASLLVSYARARAEGLGVDCRVGLVQRAERILLVGVPSVLWGAGPRGQVLFWIVAILALASVITVVQRFVYVYQVTEGAAAPETPKGSS